MKISSHHYALDAVDLLDDCIESLLLVLNHDRKGKYGILYDLKELLVSTERLLHGHLITVLQTEKESIPGRSAALSRQEMSSLQGTVSSLKEVLEEKKRLREQEKALRNPQEADANRPRHPTRNATDTLLFGLIVDLQLCLVRIDDAHLVLVGRRIKDPKASHTLNSSSLVAVSCCAGVGAILLARQRNKLPAMSAKDSHAFSIVAAKVGVSLLLMNFARKGWNYLWMKDKIVRSITILEDWQRKWELVLSTSSKHGAVVDVDSLPTASPTERTPTDLLDPKSKKLIEYVMSTHSKPSMFQSQGEMRFMMVKRFMDVFYASVGTAIDTIDGRKSAGWQLPVVTAAAASFYSLTGASSKASAAVSSSSRDLIRSAWGMVSLPQIKSLMLQATKLLKGAALADRIEINGVPCFVLSKDPVPEVVAALKRESRRPQKVVSRLSTINESQVSDSPDKSRRLPRKFAGAGGRYRQRDVILHITGGGFFAHTIATDVPYLLDWSATCGAVVVCPEYALLPEHCFPVALTQVHQVYSALLNGDAVADLGFEVDKVIVTGESAGGNLAAALCTKIGSEITKLEDEEPSSVGSAEFDDGVPKMPAGMMLSCAALNLSLELSLSRAIGSQDPVLPSGLISAISDAYLPVEKGFSKEDPLASPFFASDKILQLFPPTLLFAGSTDPLLDDSVHFNERLLCLGVASELRAAHNMPHAYWGLGTAGFPEAQQVQQECREWLSTQFSRDEKHQDSRSDQSGQNEPNQPKPPLA